MRVAVIVLFNPDLVRLKQCVFSIVDQLDYLIFINNSSIRNPLRDANSKFIDIECVANIGIAAAQNIGLKKALEISAKYILLSDQDTIFPLNYLNEMTATIDSIADAGCVVPVLVDDRGGVTVSPFKIRKWGMKWRLRPSQFGQVTLVEAPASGMLIKADVVSKIGLMREDLFIDLVDLEWCWRVSYNKLKILGICGVAINHRLGNNKIKLPFKIVNSRDPIRTYYISRNTLFLAKNLDYISIIDKISLCIDCLKYLVGFSILFSPHILHFKYSLKGLYHGYVGRVGNLDVSK